MADFAHWIIHRFSQSEVFPLYQRICGRDLSFPLLKCIFRYQRPDHAESILPFHQDAEGGKFDCMIINCWTALDACGVDAPGIEVVKGSVSGFFTGLGLVGTFRESSTPYSGWRWPGFRSLRYDRTYMTSSMTKPHISERSAPPHERAAPSLWQCRSDRRARRPFRRVITPRVH